MGGTQYFVGKNIISSATMVWNQDGNEKQSKDLLDWSTVSECKLKQSKSPLVDIYVSYCWNIQKSKGVQSAYVTSMAEQVNSLSYI